MLFLSSRICHAGECDDSNCTQPCKEPRLNCGHPCNAPCHDGKFCTHSIQIWWKREFCFHEKIRFYHKLSDVFINNYLQQVNVPIPLAWKR